jgi:hypothetical protein
MRILRGLGGTVLPCGCLAGVYETYDGEIVTLIDTADASCRDDRHKDGNPIPKTNGTGVASQK